MIFFFWWQYKPLDQSSEENKKKSIYTLEVFYAGLLSLISHG